MKLSTKASLFLPLLATLLIVLPVACGSPPPVQLPPPAEKVKVSPMPDEPSGLTDRVDVVYFHRPQRCKKCICFEERISYVMETHFQENMDSGKLNFRILNLGDEENTTIANKYGAVGSQLFINTIKDNVEHSRNIQEIWSWGCTDDTAGFDEAVRSVIDLSLLDEE